MGLVLLAGCRGASDEDMPESVAPTAVAFKGRPEPAYVGRYKTLDGRSNYTLGADGAFELKGKAYTPGGAFDTNTKGSWAVDGDRLLFKYGEGNVVPYKYAMEGNRLKLTLTGSLKRETVLVKQ